MISVCIATHNGASYILEELQSIIPQLCDDDEIIVSDDGSTDNTINLIESLHDSRIKIINFKQPEKSKYTHQYVSKNFENALRRASGDYIFIADQDDVWLPGKVSVCLQYLSQYDLVLHNLECCDGYMNSLGFNVYETFTKKNLFIKIPSYYGCAMAFNRKVLDYALPFPNHLMMHDFWIGILSEYLGTMYFIRTPLLRYRMHGGNTTVTDKRTIFYSIRYRVVIWLNLFVRILQYKNRCR